MANNLIINTKTLVQILKAQGLKTPGVIDIEINENDINLKNLEVNVIAIVDSALSNVMWVVLELQKSLYSKLCTLIDNSAALVNIQIVLKEENQNE